MAALSMNCTGLGREKDVRLGHLGRPRPFRQKIVVSNVGREVREPERSVIAARFWIAVWLDSRSLTIASSGCWVNGQTLLLRRSTFLGVNLNQKEGVVNWQFTLSLVALGGVWA